MWKINIAILLSLYAPEVYGSAASSTSSMPARLAPTHTNPSSRPPTLATHCARMHVCMRWKHQPTPAAWRTHAAIEIKPSREQVIRTGLNRGKLRLSFAQQPARLLIWRDRDGRIGAGLNGEGGRVTEGGWVVVTAEG